MLLSDQDVYKIGTEKIKPWAFVILVNLNFGQSAVVLIML
jgi:hypothetical protein